MKKKGITFNLYLLYKLHFLHKKSPLRFKKYFNIKNQLVREFLAELFGTWILVFFINGCVAQNTFSKRDGYESLLSVNLTCGFAVTLAVLAVGKVSGKISEF